MKRCTGRILIGGALIAGLTYAPHVAAKPAYTKQEGTACTTCHVKSNDKTLNPIGKCYAEKKDLAACKK